MAASFSQQLEELLNPQPRFADPEDDADEATKARLVERFSEAEEEEEEEAGAGVSALRKRNAALLLDADRRYAGRPVSRKQLLREAGGSGEEEEEVDLEEEEEGSVEDEDVDSMEDEEEEDLKLKAKVTSHTKDSDVTFPEEVDFYKMTEGMDELGVSEDDDDDDGEDDDDDDSEDDSAEDDDDKSEDAAPDEHDAVRTFSRARLGEEVERGLAVQNQLGLWDQLLEARIRVQRALGTANQLPQPAAAPEFSRRGGAEYGGALRNAHKALKALQRSLLELHDELLLQNPDTRAVAAASAEEEDAGPKRKLGMADYPDVMAKRFAAFEPYRNATLQRWHDKTRLTTGKGSGGGFGAFDRNVVTQVEQVLMDRERLLRRTQTRRSEYRVLGKTEASSAAPPGEPNAHLKDLDEDIFDDDDFYHQLLRELIERRTSVADPNDQVAMGRQWLAIQRLRSKVKKKVDTKASKGRKVRFHVHSKLVNFMAPVDLSAMSDEARSELYRGLFGRNAAAIGHQDSLQEPAGNAHMS